MTSVKVVYNKSAVVQRGYLVSWSLKDLEWLMLSIKGTEVIKRKDTVINCKTQEAYMIVTRFLMAPKVIA